MKTIALTGGIGSGKSTVASALVGRGAKLVDADVIVRGLQQKGEPAYNAMVQCWGETILANDGSLNRAAVADIVFQNPDELNVLVNIVNPYLYTEIRRQRQLYFDTKELVVFDLPLLVRVDGTSSADQFGPFSGIIVVDTATEVAVRRMVANRGFTESAVRARMMNQASREDRLAIADWVINNSGELSQLSQEIETAWQWILGLPHQGEFN